MDEKSRASTKRAVKLSVKATAALLDETEHAVRMRIHRRQIPHHRWGNRVFILLDELEEFLRTRPGVTVSEAAARSAAVR